MSYKRSSQEVGNPKLDKRGHGSTGALQWLVSCSYLYKIVPAFDTEPHAS